MSAASSFAATPSPFRLSGNQCNACEVSFPTSDARRAHAKSQWHVENLKRRVAGLPPLDPPKGDSPAPYEGPQTQALSTPRDSETSESDDDSNESLADEGAPEFAAEQCLFCSNASGNFDDNVTHMQKTHGLFVPGRDHLVVELETLMQYLHLIIFSYHECLYCHSQRNTAEGAQQHMIGKGHCKFDVSTEDSEFLDFYDFAPERGDDEGADEEHDEEADGEAGGREARTAKFKGSTASISKIDDHSARLPSGKLLSHRSAARTHHGRPQNRSLAPSSVRHLPSSSSTSAEDNQSPIPDPAHLTRAPSKALTKSEKRDNALSMQLATLSVKDRTALAHLSVPEQRAVLATQNKQMDKARRADRRHRSRLEMIGNRTLMQHFKPDVPGRTLG